MDFCNFPLWKSTILDACQMQSKSHGFCITIMLFLTRHWFFVSFSPKMQPILFHNYSPCDFGLFPGLLCKLNQILFVDISSLCDVKSSKHWSRWSILTGTRLTNAFNFVLFIYAWNDTKLVIQDTHWNFVQHIASRTIKVDGTLKALQHGLAADGVEMIAIRVMPKNGDVMRFFTFMYVRLCWTHIRCVRHVFMHKFSSI